MVSRQQKTEFFHIISTLVGTMRIMLIGKRQWVLDTGFMFVDFNHHCNGNTTILWISDHIVHVGVYKFIISCTSMCNLPLYVVDINVPYYVPRFSLDQVSTYVGIKPHTWVNINPHEIVGFDDFCDGLY